MAAANPHLKYQFSVRDIIVFYLQFFLIVDLINGFFLSAFTLSEALSPGQLVRFLIFLLINYHLFLVNKTYASRLIIFYWIVAVFLLVFFSINNLQPKAIISEISFAVKLVMYLLIFLFARIELNKTDLQKIVYTTFYIFSIAILFTYFSGVGIDGYRTIEASKGFFHANNSTSLVGLTLTLYFYLIEKKMRMVFLMALVLFFTGSKIFIIALLILLGHYAVNAFRKFIRLKPVILLYIPIFITFLYFGVPVAREKVWENRYKVRVLGAFYNSAKQGLLHDDQNPFIKVYSYISTVRAYNTMIAIDYLSDHSQFLISGLGSYFTKYHLFGESEAIETDFTDILVMYGIFGLLFYLIFHIGIIMSTPAPAKYIAILILLYSIIAGHYVYNPMSYTLSACIMAYFIARPTNDNEKETQN